MSTGYMNALALIELSTVSSGVRALDFISKAAEVEVLAANPVCPGKYMIVFIGSLGAVEESLNRAIKNEPERIIDSMCLGNPSDSLLSAMYGTTAPSLAGAVGVIETYTGASALLAADAAAKASSVELNEIRLSRGMCGKSFALFTGSLSDVEASLESAKRAVSNGPLLADFTLVANPDKKIIGFLY